MPPEGCFHGHRILDALPQGAPSQSAFSPPSGIFSHSSSRHCPGFSVVLKRRDGEQYVYLSFPEADIPHAFNVIESGCNPEPWKLRAQAA